MALQRLSRLWDRALPSLRQQRQPEPAQRHCHLERAGQGAGIGHSPPYDSSDSQNLHNGTAIWNELGKVLGGMDSPIDRHPPAMLNAAISKPTHDRSSFMDLTPRSASIDLGIPMGSSSSPSCTNQGINNVVDSQTNSLPFTLNGLINH